MNLDNEEYSQVEPRSMCTISTPGTKECPFTGHESIVLEISDIEQQD